MPVGMVVLRLLAIALVTAACATVRPDDTGPYRGTSGPMQIPVQERAAPSR